MENNVGIDPAHTSKTTHPPLIFFHLPNRKGENIEKSKEKKPKDDEEDCLG